MFLFVLIFIDRIIIYYVKWWKTPSYEIRNAFSVLVDLFFIIILVYGILYIFEAEFSLILGSSAFFITIIGITSYTFVTNLVGGIYILLTRPFGKHDLIIVNNIIGVVEEIGLNYTRLRALDKSIVIIPNGLLINITLLNTKNLMANEIKRKAFEEQLEQTTKTIAKQLSIDSIVIPRPIRESILDTFGQEGIIRFSIVIQIEPDLVKPPIKINDMQARIDRVIQSFTSVFGFEPRIYFGDHIFRQDIHVVLTTNEVKKIFDNYSLFLEALTIAIYQPLQCNGEKENLGHINQ